MIHNNPIELPLLGTHFENDVKLLAQYVQANELLLAKLPVKHNRDAQQAQLAQRIFTACRSLRSQFIDRYADEVYAILTDRFSHSYRLSDLVAAAAERFSGLVPSRAQMEIENGYLQAHKDGLEIDQGIFFRGLLRSPEVGSHLMDAMLLPCPRALQLRDELQCCDKLDLGSILFERQGPAAHLTINNQYCLNAEDDRLIADLETAVDLVLLDDRIKVGVLRGGVMTHPRYLGKRVFCSGINLTHLHDGKISYVDFLLGRELGYISKIMHGLLPDMKSATIQKPWLAVVDSFAIGGGMQLLLVFDKVIAASDAYFVLPAAQEGIIPGAANFRLPRIVGNRLSRQIILSGRKILASDVAAQQLCDEVLPSSAIDAALEAHVQALNNPAVIENRRMINLAEESRDQFREYMAEFATVQAARLYSSDVLAKIARWSRTARVSARNPEEQSC